MGKLVQEQGINNSNQVVGLSTQGFDNLHAFFYDGVMHDLGTLGGDISAAFAINNAGHIVGYSNPSVNGYNHAFLYEAGHMTDLGLLGNLNSATAYAINNEDQIVGSSYNEASTGHAFLFDNGAMLDLNSLLDASGVGWTLLDGRGINDHGWITGDGTDPSGDVHAFELIPVPEPKSSTMTLIGIVGSVVLRRKAGVRYC